MGGIDDLLPCRVLAVMRAGRDWTQKDLAVASGERSEMISNWENGRPVPTREVLVRMAAAMGYREWYVDQTFAHLECGRPVIPGGSGDIEEKIAALAQRLAGEHERTFRYTLQDGIRQCLAILEREISEERWLALRDLEPAARRLVVESDARYRRWGLAERLAEESARAAADESSTALNLAELALEIAHSLPSEGPWNSRVQGYVYFFLANARRVAGDLPAAEMALSRGKVLWNAGVAGDPGLLDEGRLFDLEASLRRAQRRLPEALTCLEQAVRRSTPEELPRLLVLRAKNLEELGEAEEALLTLLDALPRVDPSAQPRLAWSIRFNLVVNLCSLDRAAEGEPWLAELGEMVLELGNALDRVRFRWLQGRVHALLGRRREAQLALAEARDSFLERKIAFDAALVSLELALLFLEQSHTSEVKDVARRLAPIFEAQGVDREAMAALLVFQAAAEAEAITVAGTRLVLDFLRRAQLDPSLRWSGEA